MLEFLQKSKFLLPLLGCLVLAFIPFIKAETPQCGQRNVGGVDDATPRSSNIGESDFGEFPWTIALVNAENRVHCSGSLIHPKVVLTSVRCAFRGKADRLKLCAGLWDRQVNNDHLPYQERLIERVILHPQVQLRQKRNDVALIVLNEPFALATHIQTICLPSANHVTTNGTTGFATGWGGQSTGGDSSQKMKRVILKTVDRETCEAKMDFKLNNSVLCAIGENGTDTCTSDGGGPLVSRISLDSEVEVYHQIGITSFGASCFQGIPGGYTNVANVREWIDAKMHANGFEISSYVA